ncbi:MAG: hypothetical protein HY329_07405, partial [Chloroflexi bacterium]|nr:hypothetical protein [Chloroflexota bacterium]
MTTNAITPTQEYVAALAEYLISRSESALYRASMLSQRLIAERLGPEEIVAIHMEALDEVTSPLPVRERARAGVDALQFLLEVMIAYGVQYKEYTELKLTEHGRELEAERRRAAEATLSEREHADLLILIAHELRAPMTAVLGNLDFAVRSLATGRAERVPDLLTKARTALGRLDRLADDLVEASRGELQHRAKQPVDLRQLVAEPCQWGETSAELNGLSFTCELPPEPIVVLGDADGLQTALSNLLSNAIRYTPAGGRVTVRCGQEGAKAFVAVVDTGIGLSAEALEHMFEKFYR